MAIEPIVLQDVKLYGADGKPLREYSKVTVGGEAVKDTAGDYVLDFQAGWVRRHRLEGTRMLDYPLAWAIIERLSDDKNPAVERIISDMQRKWLMLGTRIRYDSNRIIHGYGFESPIELSCAFPIGDHWDHWLYDIKSKREWQKVFQALWMPKEWEKAVDVFNSIAGVPAYILTADDRRSSPKRAAALCVDESRFYLGCIGDIDAPSRSLSVTVE